MTKSSAKPNKKMAQMLCFRLQPDNKAISAQVDSIFHKGNTLSSRRFYSIIKRVAEIDAETISFLWVSLESWKALPNWRLWIFTISYFFIIWYLTFQEMVKLYRDVADWISNFAVFRDWIITKLVGFIYSSLHTPRNPRAEDKALFYLIQLDISLTQQQQRCPQLRIQPSSIYLYALS